MCSSRPHLRYNFRPILGLALVFILSWEIRFLKKNWELVTRRV